MREIRDFNSKQNLETFSFFQRMGARDSSNGTCYAFYQWLYLQLGHSAKLKEMCYDSHLHPRGLPSGEGLTSLLLAWLQQQTASVPIYVVPFYMK